MSKQAKRGPMGHGPMAAGGAKAKNFKGSGKKLLRFLAPFKWALIIVIIFAAISTVFNIVGPKVLALATDELVNGIMQTITGGQGGIDFTYIGQVILILVGLYVISSVFSYIQG